MIQSTKVVICDFCRRELKDERELMPHFLTISSSTKLDKPYLRLSIKAIVPGVESELGGDICRKCFLTQFNNSQGE